MVAFPSPSKVTRATVTLNSPAFLSRLAVIAARATLVAGLRLDAGKLRQTGNPVRADAFTLLQQVIVQLAITVNLATLVPGLVQQLGLALVSLRLLAQWGLQPSIKPARLDAQATAHRTNIKLPRCSATNAVAIGLEPMAPRWL